MKIFLTKKEIDEIPTEAVLLTFFSDEKPLKGELGLLDWRMNGYISKQLEKEKIKGNLGENTLILASPKLNLKKIYLFGMGTTKDLSEEKIDTVIDQIKNMVSGMNPNKFSFALSRNITDRKAYRKFLKYFFNSFAVTLKEKIEAIYFHYERDEEKEALLPLKSNNIKLYEERTGNL